MERISSHGRSEPRRECCGILAGRAGIITHVFAAANASSNPATSYEIAPREIFDRIREMRAAGLEFLGIYHSHPHSPNEPSPRDIAQAYYPDAAYFILSPLPEAPRPVRAFAIRDGRVMELQIEIVPEEEPQDESS